MLLGNPCTPKPSPSAPLLPVWKGDKNLGNGNLGDGNLGGGNLGDGNLGDGNLGNGPETRLAKIEQ